ncbi:DUF421 domain-containing protein [Pseudorhodobacter turbinis]|uniref:DUF421 domain-containing protein n=1 Tax=Pseudorhodobacter turbinis TaxID=2500533 RepID=A0A4P8ED50_9RHOB|nr:YetF domain-containing protein [Pseudorhodobacter turbinis]QCO54648.1 DUF421 domain-containing protein [Pseudorhodobacter turbinis]
MFFDGSLADAIAKGSLLSTFGLAWIILLVRIVGLRSFSKMTNFDFVMTVAMGSLLAGASQSETWPGLLQTLTAMGCLFAVQFGVSGLRQRYPGFDDLVQNTPILLMKDGTVLHDALIKTRVSEEDLIAKLREANVLSLSSVRAVVLETTGDISVLHGRYLEENLLNGVAHT